ncbi:hypothetical protein DFH08DRAFT_750223 [Mycena albidolilacea]|uniref:MYND-type domain-containing protein n=1 Tax=Mycena albidolilacea TaxID=1033008 RepID=A0AAD7EKE0_9AGAR|nr:hypothetical protein DFH08DRAFT_750223 [Mycena albidolilacea]
MGICYNDGCLNQTDQQCSNCKLATYCSTACQKKGSLCTQRTLPGCEMNRILREHQEKEEVKPVERPRTTHCTGCNTKYSQDYEAEEECPDCGYSACESCVSDTSSGSCYCQNSNFGRLYCEMNPRWYHMSSRTGRSYKGDRHPEEDEEEDAFEKKARQCGNCKETRLCLRKEYC